MANDEVPDHPIRMDLPLFAPARHWTTVSVLPWSREHSVAVAIVNVMVRLVPSEVRVVS